MLARWTYEVDVEIVCCLDTEVRYEPRIKTFTVVEDIEIFYTTFDKWLKHVSEEFDKYIDKYGNDKCKSLSPSLYMCEYKILKVMTGATR